MYDGLYNEDIRLKSQNLCAIFWKDLHKVFVNISEQYYDENSGIVATRILTRIEGDEALLRPFEDICSNCKRLSWYFNTL